MELICVMRWIELCKMLLKLLCWFNRVTADFVVRCTVSVKVCLCCGVCVCLCLWSYDVGSEIFCSLC